MGAVREERVVVGVLVGRHDAAARTRWNVFHALDEPTVNIGGVNLGAQAGSGVDFTLFNKLCQHGAAVPGVAGAGTGALEERHVTLRGVDLFAVEACVVEAVVYVALVGVRSERRVRMIDQFL